MSAGTVLKVYIKCHEILCHNMMHCPCFDHLLKTLIINGGGSENKEYGHSLIFKVRIKGTGIVLNDLILSMTLLSLKANL